MKKTLYVLLASLSVLFFTAANAKDQVIEGVISEYICGDRCGLTIVDAQGGEHNALCAAPLCEKFDESDMSKFKGRKVKATIGSVEMCVDGQSVGLEESCQGSDKMVAFTKIILLK
ncbi:hypothetical protein CKO12_13520 [Chromatium okenii]|uniref:hypothetical protein n=1 Tax=Chromatium okenii TaxID=61644 RepID=UPI001903625B|nr:hypothetical protein [Chromatium okenii]MBK1642869.1 hypothetical protein [Chromatium okenii]